MDEVFTVYKLIILYILDRSDGDVTQPMMSSFLLESGYANFISLAESYKQLEQQGLVRVYVDLDRRGLHAVQGTAIAFRQHTTTSFRPV